MLFSMTNRVRLRLALVLIAFSLVFTATGCFDVKINGQSYPKDTDYFTVTEKNIEDYSLFNQFDNLKTLDLTSIDISPSDYEKITSQVDDDIFILWNVPIGNTKLPSDSRTIDITPEIQITDTSVLPYFKKLESVNISAIPPSQLLLDICNSANQANPDVAINCTTSVYGVEINSSTQFLNLNAVNIEDLSELDYALAALPNIKTVEMCSCRLDNEVIAAFRDKYPDRKIVWAIRIRKYVIRTDAQIFSTLVSASRLNYITSEAVTPIFKYCTELRALDIGHCNLSDLSEIKNLKHLHTLILADNFIKDVSPVAELKELNYVEMQYNTIKDATPFGELPELEDFYIVHNPGIKNVLAIANSKNLKRVDVSACNIRSGEFNALKNQLPEGCYLKRKDKGDNIKYWRMDNAKNAGLRNAFAHWETIKEFPDWENPVYWDRDAYDFSENKAE